jgi:hypothetical protein
MQADRLLEPGLSDVDGIAEACTRARDHLLVSGVGLASEFLDDLRRSAHKANSNRAHGRDPA